MPPVQTRRSGIPRPAGSKPGDAASTAFTHGKPRKSSSSDADAEYSSSTEAARAKISKPLKMQGPFRPSIVGRMAKTADWQFSKRGKGKSKASEATTGNRRRSHEDDSHTTRQAKSKSRSPPDYRPVFTETKSRKRSDEKEDKEKVKGRIQTLSKQINSLANVKNQSELKRENKELHERLESLSKEVCLCKEALEKCHIDPATLEPISNEEKGIEHDTTISLTEMENTRTSLENILSQNSEMMEGLKDLLKGLS